MKKSFIASFIFFTGFVIFSSSSFAVVVPGKDNMSAEDGTMKVTNRETLRTRVEEKVDAVKTRTEQNARLISTNSAQKRSLKQQKLTTAKLKICENRKKTIQNRSQNMVKQTERMISVFESITTKVTDFYNQKRVPQGKTVADYSKLMAEVEAKKQAVNSAVGQAKTTGGSFDCSGNDPVGQLRIFKDEMKDVISALKDYRQAVRNLIVAVAKAGNVNKVKTSTGAGVISPAVPTSGVTPVATVSP